MPEQTAAQRLPVGVCAYSFPFNCGFLQREGCATSEPFDAQALIDLATTWGLSGVETPLARMLPDLSLDTIDRFRVTLEERGLTLVVDTGIVEPEALREVLPLATRAGARVVRATLSSILEGARAGLPGGWDAYLDQMRRRIVELRPALEQHDLVLALENHQDATSDDLLALCEAGAGRVGITFDVANPLAVAEEPLQFARKVGPWVRNVHLKDYQVFATPSGYRLVRCALGQGVVRFEELLPLLREVAPGASLHIELAALYGRHIRLLEDDWWQGYPSRDVREVLPALRLLAREARPAEDAWQTPWERESPSVEVGHYEREQFEASVRYLRSLLLPDTMTR